MKTPKATARFQKVAAAAGRPEPLTLWLKPAQDQRFKTARDEHRILTVKQETVGTKKDFGIVGFHKEKNASYWVFPKSLDAFAGKKIIGIKYDQLQSEEGLSAGVVPPAKSKPRPNRTQTQPREKNPTRYRVTVRCLATVELTQEVEARTTQQAKAQAMVEAAKEEIDFSKGQLTCNAVSATLLENRAAGLGARLRRLRG